MVQPALFCEEVGTQAAAAAAFDASCAAMRHLDDCARRIRGGAHEPGWRVEAGSGDLFVQLPQVGGHAEAAGASVCGLCAQT